jgi:hypothetical protein
MSNLNRILAKKNIVTRYHCVVCRRTSESPDGFTVTGKETIVCDTPECQQTLGDVKSIPIIDAVLDAFPGTTIEQVKTRKQSSAIFEEGTAEKKQRAPRKPFVWGAL